MDPHITDRSTEDVSHDPGPLMLEAATPDTPINNPVSATSLTLTVPDAAELLGISRGTAYECVRAGQLPAIRLRRRILIPRLALEQVLSAASPNSGPSIGEDQA